jgi:hypothetical protein
MDVAGRRMVLMIGTQSQHNIQASSALQITYRTVVSLPCNKTRESYIVTLALFLQSIRRASAAWLVVAW